MTKIRLASASAFVLPLLLSFNSLLLPLFAQSPQDGAQVAALPPISAAGSVRPQVWVYDFTASWCPSCQLLKPVLSKAASRFGGFAYIQPIDVDTPQGQALVAKLGIKGIPTLILMDSRGKTLNVLTGYAEGKKIDNLLSGYQKQVAALNSSLQ